MKRVFFGLAVLFVLTSPVLADSSKIKFWNEQRKGANWFNVTPTREWLVAAKEAGIEVVRLAPDNWKSQQRDFLIGSADRFDGIVEQDFQKLKQVLDLMTWYAKVENTPADLNRFNATIVAAIREVDKETPIVIDCGWWATAYAIQYLKPLRDNKVLYSVHMYEPYSYTSRKTNNGRFSYPGKVLVETDAEGETKQVEVNLNSVELEKMLNPVAEWQKRHRIKSNRIFVGEFGCNRMVSGAANYLSDLINIFNQHNWHWAFFTFRQDSWDGMDYEIGTKPPGWAYWQAVERGETPQPKREDNALWDVLKRELKK